MGLLSRAAGALRKFGKPKLNMNDASVSFNLLDEMSLRLNNLDDPSSTLRNEVYDLMSSGMSLDEAIRTLRGRVGGQFHAGSINPFDRLS